jgi:renalase
MTQMEFEMPDNRSDRLVAIVGAGIAGLSCARMLADSGLSVTVFEKSHGPGGRMSTRRVEAVTGTDANETSYWQCDHGAQYFTARSPAFIEQVEQWEQAGVIVRWQPDLKTVGERPGTLNTTARHSHRYVGTPRMTAPAHHLAQGLTLISGTRVTGIRHTDQGWFLMQEHTPEAAGPFTDLILAIPAQQAEDLLGLMRHQQNLFPTLEQALSLCQKHALRPCWALMMNLAQTQTTGDHINADFDALFVNPGADRNYIASWIARDNSKPERPRNQGDTWLLHANPEWSLQHLESEQQLVVAALLSEFRALTGINAELLSHSLHRWRFAQTGNTENCPGELWLREIGLGLCGDWLNGGRVEGAWLSGRQLANRILTPR